MIKSVSWFVALGCLTLGVGPIALVASQAGRADRTDLYFLLDIGAASLSRQQLTTYGAGGVGPLRGKLAQMIHAPPASRQRLRDAGYLLMPAGALAAICGIDTADTNTIKES